MGVQTLHADARAADAAARLRAVGAHRGATTALGVLLVGRGNASASTRSSKRWTPPAPSRRLTASCISGSTSQKSVGIGVPSRRCGSFSMTTGRPSSRRTTTAQRPARGRPRYCSTTARSPGDASRKVNARTRGCARGAKRMPSADEWCFDRGRRVRRHQATRPTRARPGAADRGRRCSGRRCPVRRPAGPGSGSGRVRPVGTARGPAGSRPTWSRSTWPGA